MSDDFFLKVSGFFLFVKILLKWRIKFIKKNDKLGIFLECLFFDNINSLYGVLVEFYFLN